MKRTFLLKKITSPARDGYDIIASMVSYAENTTDLYNDIENKIAELNRAKNNLYAAATTEQQLED